MKLSSLWAETYVKPSFLLIATIAILIWASDVLAYDDYAGGCDNCHGDFRDSPYISLSDGSDWGDSLHNVHRNDMLGGDCETCHAASGFSPVSLESSEGGSGLAAISCVGCHGRDEDNGNATTNGTSQRGAGLRQHHEGEANCSGCHDDQTGYTPVGENVLPNYYANPGTGHPAMPTDSCNPSGGENFAGTAPGLDNDGDGIYDTSDSDCSVVADTATLTLAKTVVNDEGGTAVDTDFTLTATGPDTISGIEGAPAITNATVAVGAYALTESSLADYTLQGWACTSGLSGSTVTLAKDQVVTCTATNTDDPVMVVDTATLTLAKTVVNDEGGTAVDTDFTLTATGPDTISGIEGAPAITNATVAVGAYALTESSLADYTLQGWACTSGLSGSTVTLAKDQVVTCTATNTDDPFVATPALAMSKSANPSTFNTVGELIDYRYMVSSTGNVPVTGPITVSDSLMTVTCPPVSSVGNGDGDLDPGESLVCTSSYVVQQADFDAGFITSSSIASGGNASTGIIPITVSFSEVNANAIPTLSEWTMILLSFLFLLMGFGYLRRRAMI